jgi:hypothetical protein
LRILITDLTEMHGGNFCVAGWDAQGKRMIRPLPNGANWTDPLLQQYGVRPGATIDVIPTGTVHTGFFPHATEGTPIDRQNISLTSIRQDSEFRAMRYVMRARGQALF